MDNELNVVGNEAMEWPYPIRYDTVNHIYVDTVVVGGGLSGGCAALSAARQGAKVAVVDKAPIKRSGNGGAGMDHWNGTWSCPDSPMTPEEAFAGAKGNLGQLHNQYIAIKGAWDALLELEHLGLRIRDDSDEFAGKPTRDEKSRLLKAFDYRNIVAIKIRDGYYIKPTIYNALRSHPNVSLYERVMITNILTEEGKQGARVVGATGFSMKTGEFYVFHCKSVVLSTGYICGCWISNLELTGNSYRWDPNEVGEGMAIAWKAGAEVYGMWKHGSVNGNNPFAWPRFGVGTPGNTWFPCTLVDNNGKEIPFEDPNGKIIETVAERNIPAEGIGWYGGAGLKWGRKEPAIIHDLDERIRKGEYELPLWADIAGMPDEERRSIWGLMIGNEGKTRFTLYDYYTRWGFDPEKDMLMCPIMEPEKYVKFSDYFVGDKGDCKPWRTERKGQGEIASDWNLSTTVPGLYVAGAAGGLEGCAAACSTGFYAGNRAAEYALEQPQGEVFSPQLEEEIERVYAPVRRAEEPGAYISWKELWAGSARVMQSDCAEYLTIPILEHGLMWLDSIKNYEMKLTYARNPHELARVLECETRITCSEVYLHTCIAKLKSEAEGVGPEKHVFTKLNGEKVETIVRESEYWLKTPNAATYLENYQRHTAAQKEAS